jgi:hypothetical protein
MGEITLRRPIYGLLKILITIVYVDSSIQQWFSINMEYCTIENQFIGSYVPVKIRRGYIYIYMMIFPINLSICKIMEFHIIFNKESWIILTELVASTHRPKRTTCPANKTQ